MEGRCGGDQSWQDAAGKKSAQTSERKHYRAADEAQKGSARTDRTKESATEVIKGYGAMIVELSASNCYNDNGFLYAEIASIPALR